MTTSRNSKVLRTISLMITIFSLSFPAYAKYSGGIGEPNEPYQIATAEDLILLGQSLEDYDKHFIMTADIDLSGQIFTAALIAPDANDSTWGFDGNAFTGVFDGNGHKITGLTIDDGGARNDFLGLFGCISGKIANLGIEGSSVSGSKYGSNYVGSLVGRNDRGEVSNCYSTADVRGDGRVGGLVGHNEGTVSNSHSAGKVGEVSGVGGLIGRNSGIVSYSYSTCEVVGTDGHVGGLGGLIGDNSGIVWGCYATGDVIGVGSSVGGLAGSNSSYSIVSTVIRSVM